jgi:hypothetical protein
MRRVFAFFSSRPFVSIGVIIGILTLVNVALVSAVVEVRDWQIIYLQNNSVFVGRAIHEGSFVRVSDVHLLKQLPTLKQEAQASHFAVQGAIDLGYEIQDFELPEIVLGQSEIRLITTLSNTSPIVIRLNQMHAHE